jgi:hypothetical protein
MPVHQFTVRYYVEALGDEMSATWGGVQIKARSYIAFYGDEGYRLIAYFLAPGSDVPKPTFIPANKVAAIFLPAAELPVWQTLVLYEKPLYAYMNDAHPEWNGVRTGAEPAGEEET